MWRALFAVALALGVALAGTAVAQTAQMYLVTRGQQMSTLWYGTATTNANGQWSLTIPAGTFTTSLMVSAPPISSDNTAPNAAYASVVVPTQSGGAWTVSGLVLLPSTVQALGALSAKAAGQGTVVMVTAVGY